jgi:hypothetical protein
MNSGRTAHIVRRDNLWDKFWYDSRGKVVVFQWPNIWLIGWVVLAFLSMVVPRGKSSDIFWWASTAVLAFWALLEIFKGVNYFRRLLGAAVLLLTIASAFNIGR